MEDNVKGNILFELLQINLIRKQIIKHIPSFSDMNNLVDVCKFMKCDLEKEKIERKMFSYPDYQGVLITYDEGYDAVPVVPELSILDILGGADSKDLRNRSRTFFGETLLRGNRVTYFIDLLIEEWREEDHVSLVKELAEALNLNCTTRNDVKNLKFKFRFPVNVGCIVLDALNYMKHDNITRISLPVDCFTCPPNKYSMINGNIFNGFPNLTELFLTCSSSNKNYYDLIHHKDTFKRFVQQFSTVKNPTIFFSSLRHDDAMYANELYEIISIIRMYDVKVKLRINNKCSRFKGECENCIDTMGFFSPVKQYIATAFDTVYNHKELLHTVGILETFENLSELHLEVGLDNIDNNFITSGSQQFRGFGLRKLNNLKSVKLDCDEETFDCYDSDILNLFYQLFEFTCSMMPRSVEVLQLENVPDMNDVTAKMITEYMPNIKLLKINCLTYRESDSLDNFTKLECLISCDYCPIRIPKTLKLLAYAQYEWSVKPDDIISTDNLIKSYYEKFTKRITDGKNRYILFNDVCNWHLYKCAIQKYFCRGF
uniref:F-box domain-containing protein n=1 Tax=Strongyloides papillosus TaxID=174720 RepID=A0A0N5BTI2_STREA